MHDIVLKSKQNHSFFNNLFLKGGIPNSVYPPFHLGLLWVLLGFCNHWGIRRTAFSENEETSLSFRTKPGWLLQRFIYQRNIYSFWVKNIYWNIAFKEHLQWLTFFNLIYALSSVKKTWDVLGDYLWLLTSILQEMEGLTQKNPILT